MPKTIDWQLLEAKLMDAHYDGLAIERLMPTLKDIDRLRREKNAVILAHYYQIPPIQYIADFKGDSLALAMKAMELDGIDLVVSSTVFFMAEMVKILSPDKKVVIPGLGASCSIAEGINAGMVHQLRKHYPDAGIVVYINTYADVKAAADVICTSANAPNVVEKTPGNPIIVLPDSSFAENIFKEVHMDRGYLAYRRIENNAMVFYDPKRDQETSIPLNGAKPPERNKGTCIVHDEFTPADVEHFRRMEKVDLVLAHQEVRPDVAALADMVGGTGKMINFVGKTDAKRFLYLTECDLAAPLIEAHPKRE